MFLCFECKYVAAFINILLISSAKDFTVGCCGRQAMRVDVDRASVLMHRALRRTFDVRGESLKNTRRHGHHHHQHHHHCPSLSIRRITSIVLNNALLPHPGIINPPRPRRISPPLTRRRCRAFSRITAPSSTLPPRRPAKAAHKIVPPDRFFDLGFFADNLCLRFVLSIYSVILKLSHHIGLQCHSTAQKLEDTSHNKTWNDRELGYSIPRADCGVFDDRGSENASQIRLTETESSTGELTLLTLHKKEQRNYLHDFKFGVTSFSCTV